MSWVSKRKQFAVMFDVNSFSQGVYIDAIFYCCKRFKGLNKTFFQKKMYSSPGLIVLCVK